MITINELFDYRAKVERELLLAEAKMQVVNDLIAEATAKNEGDTEPCENEVEETQETVESVY